MIHGLVEIFDTHSSIEIFHERIKQKEENFFVRYLKQALDSSDRFESHFMHVLVLMVFKTFLKKISCKGLAMLMMISSIECEKRNEKLRNR